MNQNFTDITIVLDRSGSMQSIRGDIIGGYNQFIDDQKSIPGTAALSLAQFDNQYEVVHSGIDIKDVPDLTGETFVPRGSTALFDAIGRTINQTGARLAKMSETDRPGKVVFVIITDGMENASQEFTRGQINEMISHQEEKYSWEFVFLAANQDAIATGGEMGVRQNKAMTYAHNSAGVMRAMKSMSGHMREYRMGNVNDIAFTEEDRKDQADAGA